jgi:hypothetical protein
MSLADVCLVRMTETLTDPVILTTDSDFPIYRRHSRQVVPCMTPACKKGKIWCPGYGVSGVRFRVSVLKPEH